MKKIGIITYHNHNNYGTMLQAYALQTLIDDLGYEAENINFIPDTSLSKSKLFLLRIKRLYVYIIERKKYITLHNNQKNFNTRNEKFTEFYQRNIKTGNMYYKNTDELMSNPPIYDGYVVGSDQTWNPYASNGPLAFLLPFVSESKKKGSYAPSVAVSSLTDEQKNRFVKYLSDFNCLSCREEEGSKLLESVLNREVTTVLDPTFLLSRDKWAEVFPDSDVNEEKYILTYFLGEKKEHRSFLKELSKKTGLKIVSIPASYLEMRDNEVEKKWVGPSGFLQLLDKAEIVCTDSFHGTALSIVFNKNFYSFCKTADSTETSENSRLYNVLNQFELFDRMINLQTEVPDNLDDIDYEAVNKILEKRKNESMDYLINMLRSITE